MPFTYAPPSGPPERILTFGVQGVGKSEAILRVARKCPDAQFYVVDIDDSPSYERALATEYQDLTNVHVEWVDPEDWDEIIDAMVKQADACGVGDWLVVDSMTHPWAAVQSWFVEQVFDQGEDEYFMEVRKKKADAKKDPKSLGALEGWMDWPVINKQFKKTYKIIRRCKGHVYMTAEQGRLGDDDDRDVKGLFGPYGVKPAGQKRLGHVPQTVLLLTKSRAGDYAMSTVKDRNREEMEDVELNDFMSDYLVKRAGWRPRKYGE